MTLTLDLEALGDNDGHVLIPTFPGNGQPYIVTLGWISTTPSGDISLTLPPLNVSNPGSEQAKFVIPNAHLKSIAGGSAAVRYTLVQNGAPANRESETTNVTITSLPVVLTAPLVVEANGTLVLDLAQISGSAVTVMIAAWVGQRAGDRVILNWAGTSPVFGTATPFAPVDYTDEYVVQPGGEQNPITFSVPLEYLTPLGGGTLQVSYQVVFKASGDTRSSPVTTYSVSALVLPAPLIVQAPTGTLRPMDALAGATFRATYAGMQSADWIVPGWDEILSVILWQPGDELDETVESSVPAAMIGAVIGKEIDVKYLVQRAGFVYPSETLKLRIEPIPFDSLPTPVISQASGGSLDVGALQGDADLNVQPWPFIAAGQQMWMRLEGSSNLDLPAWQGSAITDTNAQAARVPLTYLHKLANGSQLQLTLEVSFDGGVTRQAFPTGNYQVKKEHEFGFEDFESYQAGSFPQRFDTEELYFTGEENVSNPLHHAISMRNGNKFITLQARDKPATVVFKNKKPSFVSGDVAIIGTNISCMIYCYSAAGITQMSFSPSPTHHMEYRGKDIQGFGFGLVGHSGGSSEVTIELDNLRWE
jgi:hypothetical protein